MRRASLLWLLVMFLAGCGGPPKAGDGKRQTMIVFAAASLSEAFAELGKGFEAANPSVQVTFSFAGSQSLRTQLEAGAHADVFASASVQDMDSLISDGLIAQDAPMIFLKNRLILILPASNPAGIQALPELAQPGCKVVLAAEDVPVGRYTRAALDRMDAVFGSDFRGRVLANVVSNEDNVKQVVAKVQLGEADAGIVYVSDAVAATGLKTIEIPSNFNLVAEYPIAVLLESDQPDLARRFVDYVLSPSGQAVLERWGFERAD